MNKFYILLSALFLTITVNGQTFNSQNARDGESVEYCHQHTKLNEYQASNPELYNSIMQGQAELNEFMKHYQPSKADQVYVIPVVFHVIHNGGVENISDAQMYDQIAILNRDYRRLNADADNVASAFTGMPADVSIEFKLATKAPNGTCFKGITRTVSTLTDSDDGQAQLNAIFAGNDIYQGTWASNKYLNVVVAKSIGGAAGYTMYPNNWGTSANSIFILNNYVGSIGTSSVGTSRALTHEIGHWLNLSHVWGDSNNPGVACGDDGVTDTPITKGWQYCPTENASKICNPSIVENYENYMDYSYCSKMFTPGQVTRMRAAIVSSVGGRSNIWSTSNLNAVGAVANPPLCKADFMGDKLIVCAGQSIQFTDQSYNLPVAGWAWTFPGGTPASSTAQNPSIVYNTPGTYSVSLTATRGASSESTTKTGYIIVLEEGGSLPILEGFENYTTVAQAQNLGKFFIGNPGNNAGFEITTTAAHSGSKSIKLNNHSQSGSNLDEFISNSTDLSNEVINDVTFSFRYAYRRKSSSSSDYLKVYFSSDCGENWILRKPLSSTTMSNVIVSSSWTPTANDWNTIHIPFNSGVYNQFLVSNFRYKFAFEGNGGNNIYIDDINIYNGAPSDEIVLGVNAIESINDVTLFPNPNDGEVNISFGLDTPQKVTFKIMDLSGKVLKSTIIQGNSGNNLIMLDNSDLSAGVYLVQLSTDSVNKILQFVKK